MSTFLPSNPSTPRITDGRLPASPAEMAIVIGAIVLALYFGKAVLMPLALAVILSFVLAPPVRVLRRVGLPNAPAVFLVVALAFAVIFAVGALITQQVGSLAEQLPTFQVTLKEKVKALKQFASGGGAIERASDTLKDLQQELERPEEAQPPPAPILRPQGTSQLPIPVEVREPEPTSFDQLQTIIGVILTPLATAGITILFTLFLLLQRVDVRDRAIRLLGSEDLERSTTAMDDAGHRLGSYFLALTLINTAYGIFIALALWLIGVPTPVLWGVLAMLMRFVPFIGSFVAAAFPLLLAAAVDPGWTMFLATLALFVVSEPIMGNLIEPIIQGQRTGMSPLAIVLSAAFWTLLWGPIGLLLAIPLTVVLVVLGRHVERLAFLHVLLGDTPPLAPHERFYQRMLADDPAEAVQQAAEILKKEPLVQYYDEVVIEGLRLAQADADRGKLETRRLVEIHEAADAVIDTLSDYDLKPARAAKTTAEDATPEPAAEGEAVTSADEETASPHLPMAPDPDAIPEIWKRENSVVCVASRTALDQTAACVLAQLLDKFGFATIVLSSDQAKHGALRAIDLENARLICISDLDVRDRSAHARFLARRLRRVAPKAKLIGSFWKLDLDDPRDEAVLESIPVDASARTLREALQYCLETALGADATAPDGDARPAPAAEARSQAS
jgi:predicted PurR-regulated permease PerM